MRIRAVIAALPIILLAACGSGSTSTSTSSTGTAAPSGSAASSTNGTAGSAASSAVTPLGPEVPPATVLAAAVPPAELPTATGKFGVKPVLTFPKTPPPPSLQREILTQGTGATTEKGDYLATNYLGQVWGGKVFDNSYDRAATSSFQVGEGKVVPGWDVAMVGVKVGSRVLLSLPPSDGYGSAGGAGGAIKGTDTIVFVIDIVARYPQDAVAQTNAAIVPEPKGIPIVTGAPGTEPKITIPKGVTEPKATKAYLLARGTGPKVTAGSVLAQYVVTDWAQSQTQSTYAKATAATASAPRGLQSLPVDTTGSLKDLIGVPVGSRVLVLIAASTDASTGSATPSAIVVIDVVAQG